jgi:hypothetical protein
MTVETQASDPAIGPKSHLLGPASPDKMGPEIRGAMHTVRPGIFVGASLLLAACLLAFAPQAGGAVKTDIIVLTNGDRITGEIRGLSNGILTYKTDDMGTLSVEWERIIRISSAWPFILEDLRGRRYTGALHETPKDGEVMVLAESGPVTLRLGDIVGIVRFGKRLGQRFQGNLDLGFSLQKAQKYTQLNVAANITYLSQKWELKTDFSSYFTSQEDVQDIKKNFLNFNVMRLLKKRWTAAGFWQFEQNTELNLSLRVLAGAGFGRYFLRTNRNVLSAVAAVDVTRENYMDETESKTNMEGVLGADFNAFRYWFPNMSVSSSFYAYPSLTEKGRIRLSFKTTIRYEVFRRFFVSLGFSDSYDSQPGGETTTKNDYSLTFGISWSLT